MIDDADHARQAGKPHYIEEQGAQYEGLVVWFNSLVHSAGGSILRQRPGPRRARAETAAPIMHRLATSPAADPSLNAQKEGQTASRSSSGSAAFEINYPFVWPEREGRGAEDLQAAWASAVPGRRAGRARRAPIGGYNLGVSALLEAPATRPSPRSACLRNQANQRAAASDAAASPPTLAEHLRRPGVREGYPFRDLIKPQLNSYAVRPQTPAYSDVSLAIQKTLSPPSNIDPTRFVNDLRARSPTR